MRVDLHGLTESEAIPEILSALFSLEMGSETEIEFIPGRGLTLRRVLEEILEEEGYRWYHENDNWGSYTVYWNEK